MEKLLEELKVLLATNYAFALKAQFFHWNVEGANFPQYHDFFGKIYEDVYQANDDIAELIRTLDSYAPGSFERFKQLSLIIDEYNIPSGIIMCQKLHEDNLKLLTCLNDCYKEAEIANKLGISNYLQDRIQMHEKHGWMLKSIIKS